jgi:amidohydrolase
VISFINENCPNAALTEVADTGLLVHFKGEQEGKSILLRGDIDALPIEDKINKPYVSEKNGIGHKCGHDGHTVIICGVAMYLNENPIDKGEVTLLFQPAEENGEGAQKVLKDIEAQNMHFDYVFALHNIPGEPLGKILHKSGAFTPAVISVAVKLEGRPAHAAEPWNGLNPSVVFPEILNLARSMENQDKDADDFTLFTPVYGTLGSQDYGISPGNAELHFTIRCKESELLHQRKDDFEKQVQKICDTKNVKCSFDYFQVFESNMNHPEAAAIIAKSATALNYEKKELKSPFPWGEDFGIFTQTFKGAMFGIGAGENCASLHNSDYDYPDELTPLAIDMFISILQNSQQHV